MNDGFLVLFSRHVDGHLLSSGTEGVEGLDGGLASGDRIVQVAIDGVVLQRNIVGIGIGTIAAAIDIAINGRIDADGVAAGHTARDVVAAIHIVHVTT